MPHSSIRGRWFRLALLLAAIVACALFATLAVVLTKDPQPSYQGRKLSEWIACRDKASEVDALLHMGTNIFPYLVKWVAPNRPPKWRSTIVLFCLDHESNTTLRLAGWLEQDGTRAYDANRALGLLGTNAYPALPLLNEMTMDQLKADTAARAIALILFSEGQEGWKRSTARAACEKYFQDPNPTVRQAAINVFRILQLNNFVD